MEQDIRFDFLNVKSDEEFNDLAIKIFRFQAANVDIYRSYLEILKVDVLSVDSWKDIPCLPISFFKTHQVITKNHTSQISFQSSGTTGTTTSSHHIVDLEVYEKSFKKAFYDTYGDPANYCILALLPSYLERGGSSLIYMVDTLIKMSHNTDSGFYLNQYEELRKKLLELKKKKIPVILFGVTFALLEFATKFPTDFNELIVIETGGMKGRGRELVREELHSLLSLGFGVAKIHSEYGMTELLSQAYSNGDGIFQCPKWMRVSVREINDPFKLVELGRSGGINIVDLANVFSCSFLSTQDLGKVIGINMFEVLGRFDSSDLRGCNLLVS